MRVAIVLAAGASRRWGAENKLLARVGGRPLVAWALDAALAAPAGRVLVVTGTQGSRVAATVRGPRITVVRARDHRAGLGASLRAGLAAMRPAERLAFVFLGDVAGVPPYLAARLLRALRPNDAGVRPAWRGVPGHPVLLRRPDAAALAGLTGEHGPGRGVRRIAGPRGTTIDLDWRTDRLRLRCARTPKKGREWKTLPAGSRPPRQ